MIISDFLEKAKNDFPNNIAISGENSIITYKDLYSKCRALAAYLQSSGIKTGDMASILHQNSLEYLETYFAVAIVGAILNPINYRLHPKDIEFILNDSDSKLLVTNSGLLEKLSRSKNSIPPVILTEAETGPFRDNIFLNQEFEAETLVSEDDPAHLYYTSGTTGKPKGVVLSHKNVCIHSLNAVEEFQLNENDVWLHAAPMFHLADAWATFAITAAGARHVMIPIFEADYALRLIQDKGVTISNLIPTMLNMMLNCENLDKYDLSSLRAILSGGAPIAPELVRKIIEKFGCDYIQTYGMTETSPYLTVSIPDEKMKKLSFEEQLFFKSKTGRPFKGVRLKVVREDGSEVNKDDNEVGEIIVKGDTVTKGYWKRPDETKERIKDGWLSTGDMATICPEGFVNIVDRKDDIIISGGENIFSIEIENILYEHPAVLETAVIGIPDEKWGESVCAAIALKRNMQAGETELIDFVKERTAAYKAPKKIIFVDEIPKTGSGKITKHKLRNFNEEFRMKSG